MSPGVLLLAARVALAGPGSEIVVLLDNSGSMATGSDFNGTKVPPNDPERVAVLGALLVEGLARGSADRLTVVGFGQAGGAAPQVASNAEEIRAMRYSSGTWFRPALAAARAALESSSRDDKLFMLFSDGAPTDLRDPSEPPRILGLAEHPEVGTFIAGLYGSEAIAELAQAWLAPLARSPDDLVALDATRPDVAHEIVGAFTRGYARGIGSKPEVGTLSPGGTREIPVGRYVTEVMVLTAASQPGTPYTPALRGPGGPAAVAASGDNGCAPSVAAEVPPSVCGGPRRSYAVFRAPNAPEVASSWTLSLPQASGPVEYGIILRYDLVAKLVLGEDPNVGQPVPVEASLLFRGETFDDAEFFARDGFQVSASIGTDAVTLTHAGGGRFTGTWTPADPTGDQPLSAVVRFQNTWMEKSAHQPVIVEGFLPLLLAPHPNPLDLGSWAGERRATRRCAEIDLSGSVGADRVPIDCLPMVALTGATLTCEPVPGQPQRWQVCVEARGCCLDLPDAADPQPTVRFSGRHPHYAADAVTVPVRFAVARTGLWTCWWIEILIGLGTAFTIWVVAGFVRPYSFEPGAGVRLAGSEAGLRRGAEMVLAELPGGRRGFYRNARFCVDGEGNPLRRPGRAVLALEAGPGGSTRFLRAVGLEQRDRRTGKWEPVAESEWPQGVQPGVLYRVGGLFLKFS